MLSTVLLLFLPAVLAVEISEIQGNAFRSPYVGQSVTVTGLVTAKNFTAGFWLTSGSPGLPFSDDAIYVDSNGTTVLASVETGDMVTLEGKVAEWRRRGDSDFLFRTQLVFPANVRKLSSGTPLTPVLLAANGLHPPTQQYTSLDVGGILNAPNNARKVTVVNPTREPSLSALDFWESLSGKLVKIANPTAVSYPDSHQSFWVRGDWPVTGLNERGGLTITIGPDGLPDLNPETILIGDPLDGTQNPDVWMGTNVTEIVGILTYEYGFYRVLPLTAPTVIAHNDTLQSPTALTVPAYNANCTLTFGDYNVENMYWNSTHLPMAASQIGDYLQSPDLLFLQEIQDDSGLGGDDGVVTSDRTLQTFVDSIASHSGVNYSFVYISPEYGQDGGQRGGNIRLAFLYRPERLRLVNPNPGGPLDKTEVVNNNGIPGLTFNPGRIDPYNAVWRSSRKPLVALFESVGSGEQIFAINVHMTSKLGSSSLHGNPRPPINSGVAKRTAQVQVVADFVGSILSVNANASIVTMGDFNEFVQANSVFASLNRHLKNIDEVAGILPVERYTYVYDMNAQQIDHAFISANIQPGAEVEHLHINNWVKNSSRTSDHDPSVARVKICSPLPLT